MKKNTTIIFILITVFFANKMSAQNCDSVYIFPTIEVTSDITPTIDTVSIIDIKYYDICLGESLDFTGNWKYKDQENQESPADSTFSWNHSTSNENIKKEGLQYSHTFTEKGIHQINLSITDSNNCSNKSFEKVYVRVSHTEPENIFISPDVVCIDIDSELEANTYREPGLVVPMKSKYLFPTQTIIPDKIEECSSSIYEEKIDVNNFLPNQILLSENDFDKVCINMEHQVAGQLTIELVSPNGSTVNLLPDTTTNTANNGIGAIYKLGVPNIIEDDLSNCEPTNNPPGTGMIYCWSPKASPDSTWHALLENKKLEKPIRPSDPDNNTNIYPAYFNSFNKLKGTPLNGEWTLKVDDISKGQNGYIFEWWIQFKEDIIPSNLVYKPQINSYEWTSTENMDSIIHSEKKMPFKSNIPGTYNFNMNLTDGFGCKYAGEDSVLVPTKLLVETETTIPDSCENRIGSVFVDGTGGTKPYNYFWSTLGKTASSVSFLRAGTYPYTITDATNCKYDGAITVGQRSKDITAAFTSELDTCSSKLILNNESTNSTDFIWDFGGVKQDYNRDLSLPNLGEIYNVRLIASNEHCADTVTDIINLTSTDAYSRIKFPNVFTPNEDFVNDLLSINGLRRCESGTLKIYNKWGDEVYYTIYPGAEPWNGKYLDKNVAQGTYFYVLKLNHAEFKGALSLIR
jgi:gliding motility-associated-like protein